MQSDQHLCHGLVHQRILPCWSLSLARFLLQSYSLWNNHCDLLTILDLALGLPRVGPASVGAVLLKVPCSTTVETFIRAVLFPDPGLPQNRLSWLSPLRCCCSTTLGCLFSAASGSSAGPRSLCLASSKRAWTNSCSMSPSIPANLTLIPSVTQKQTVRIALCDPSPLPPGFPSPWDMPS